MGLEYGVGSVIEPNCTMKCTCIGGMFNCTKQKCVIDGPTCYAFGYSHYQTFDSRHYDYYGNCEYVLVQPCDASGFNITGGYDEQASLLSYVRIVVPSDDLEIVLRGRNNSSGITINGVNQVVSGDGYVLQSENFEIVRISENFHVLLVTHQVRITWDASYGVGITVGQTWLTKLCGLCGLCGYYSNQHSDDFRIPNNEVVLDPKQFGASWLYKKASITCNKASSLESCPASVKEDAEAKCNELYSNVFNTCNEVVDPAPYIDKCVADYCLCHTDNRDDCYCNSLAVYASVCAANRVVILHWREVYCSKFVECILLNITMTITQELTVHQE